LHSRERPHTFGELATLDLVSGKLTPNLTHCEQRLDGEIASFQEMEEKLSAFVRNCREDSGLTRAEFASLYGLSTAVYGRYERAFSRLTVGRMVHLCELLGFTPAELLYEVAPHLFGKSRDEAEDRLKLGRLIDKLPHPTVRNLVQLIEQMTPR
jgi:transcriptional regulator with XRE-family HTH domain